MPTISEVNHFSNYTTAKEEIIKFLEKTQNFISVIEKIKIYGNRPNTRNHNGNPQEIFSCLFSIPHL